MIHSWQNHSLINKFRGAWLGSYGGAAKAQQYSNKPSNKPLVAGQIAELGAQSLVKVGYLDLASWQEQVQIIDPNLLNLAGSLPISEAIWASLPVILFYHEQPHKLAPALSSTLNFWLHPQESSALGLALGEAIALLLRKNCRPQEIINQTELEKILGLSTKFWQNLPCLEFALKEITAHTSPSYRAIAIACYCFLSTPEDFSLSIRRAILAPQPEITAALVGILSGAYNGFRGIPWGWYGESRNLFINSSESESGNLVSDRYQLIDQLFAAWAGHYHIPLNLAWQNQIVTVPASK